MKQREPSASMPCHSCGRLPATQSQVNNKREWLQMMPSVCGICVDHMHHLACQPTDPQKTSLPLKLTDTHEIPLQNSTSRTAH